MHSKPQKKPPATRPRTQVARQNATINQKKVKACRKVEECNTCSYRHCLSKVANMVLSTRISQILAKLIRPNFLNTTLWCFNRNQVEWLFNYFNQISIKYFHLFHVSKVMFWQANVYFINNAVRFKLRSILICMNIVNIGLKMFRTSNQRLSDQIRRVLKTKIFAHLEISRGHHLNICGTWKFPGGLALPTPGNFQDLEISRAWKFQGCVKPS